MHAWGPLHKPNARTLQDINI